MTDRPPDIFVDHEMEWINGGGWRGYSIDEYEPILQCRHCHQMFTAQDFPLLRYLKCRRQAYREVREFYAAGDQFPKVVLGLWRYW